MYSLWTAVWKNAARCILPLNTIPQLDASQHIVIEFCSSQALIKTLRVAAFWCQHFFVQGGDSIHCLTQYGNVTQRNGSTVWPNMAAAWSTGVTTLYEGTLAASRRPTESDNVVPSLCDLWKCQFTGPNKTLLPRLLAHLDDACPFILLRTLNNAFFNDSSQWLLWFL